MTRQAATRTVVVGLIFALCAPTITVGAERARTPPQAIDSVAAGRTSGDTALEALTRSVAAQLRCPVCQGLSLADSPSELALEMKDVVRDQLAAGRTPEQVKSYFVAKYGEWILLEPPRRGVNLLAYALPAIALVVGLGVIWLALRRWTGRATPGEELPMSDLPD